MIIGIKIDCIIRNPLKKDNIKINGGVGMAIRELGGHKKNTVFVCVSRENQQNVNYFFLESSLNLKNVP